MLQVPPHENSKAILLEFKNRLENLEVDFDRAKAEIERLNRRKTELETQDLSRKAEIDRLKASNSELQNNYHGELDKVQRLNEVILNLRSEIKSCEATNLDLCHQNQTLVLAEQTIQQLNSRIVNLEEASDKKNLIIEKWKSTLLTLTERIGKIEEDNTYFEQERELVKSTLSHVRNH